ncbi:MAG: hypothetical protein QM703_27895 [Gemmatales bacterium]
MSPLPRLGRLCHNLTAGRILAEMLPFRSEPLNQLLTQELTLGNRIVEDGPGWGQATRLVMLHLPFRSSLSELSPSLVVREVNDPHYWKSEIEDISTKELLVCRFE